MGWNHYQWFRNKIKVDKKVTCCFWRVGPSHFFLPQLYSAVNSNMCVELLVSPTNSEKLCKINPFWYFLIFWTLPNSSPPTSLPPPHSILDTAVVNPLKPETESYFYLNLHFEQNSSSLNSSTFKYSFDCSINFVHVDQWNKPSSNTLEQVVHLNYAHRLRKASGHVYDLSFA